MPRIRITAGPHDGGSGTAIYDVVSEDDGTTGLLATSRLPKRAIGDVLDAPRTPRHLAGIQFNGHLPDYFRP